MARHLTEKLRIRLFVGRDMRYILKLEGKANSLELEVKLSMQRPGE
jgi:hypothetical protein